MNTISQENLYALRLRAHEAVDALWKKRYITRQAAYNWLARSMKLKPEDCHIAQFTAEQCHEAIRKAHSRLRREAMKEDKTEIAQFFNQRLPEIKDRETLADKADDVTASPGEEIY